MSPMTIQVRAPQQGDGQAEAMAVAARVKLFTRATSLGGVETSWERRRRHSGEPENVPDALVRLSVGIENVEDVWDDIARCLDAVVGGATPAGGARREPQRTSGWV